ncbi:MAG: MMPL family transporter [Firmicutes bacterium]|nr:MMPL family transporter [Bacillota bacterium]
MKSKIILTIFALLTIVAGILITQVNVNYDLAEYLPSDTKSKIGLTLLEEEFGSTSYARIAFDENSVSDALLVKTQIQNIDHVKRVVYLDDYFNPVTFEIIKGQVGLEEAAVLDSTMSYLLGLGLSYTEAFMSLVDGFPEALKTEFFSTISSFYNEGESLFLVSFDTSNSSSETETAVDEITTYLDGENYDYSMSGSAISTIFSRNTISSEVFKITIIIIPIILIILLIMSKSFVDILIFGLVAGMAIILNLGTNAILPSISFITSSMALALQLAISLDYIIFILNSYHHEKELGNDTDTSIKNAMKKIKKPVIASALTTGVSFLALIFMRFTIGLDIGIVFAKAIFFSLIVSLVVLPILIKLFSKWIDKTTHKVYFIRFSKISKFIYKGRFVFLIFLLLVIGPAYYFQSHNVFIYGDSALSSSEGSTYYDDINYIESTFGKENQIVILTSIDPLKEGALYQGLSNLDFVNSVDAGIYYKSVITDPETLNLYLPNFYSENYALIKINLDSDVETAESFAYYEEIKALVDSVSFEESYLIGSTPFAYDIKEVISSDYLIVLLIALISIMIIIFITFRNFIMPWVLPLVIEAAVFFAMAIPYFFGTRIIFLGYLIVSTILLGATIDYAIILGKRYIEEREITSKDKSIMLAISETAPSIITSAIIFAVSGLTIYFISSIVSISQIGLLIGIGAITSMLFVLVILPQLLYIFDKWIIRSNIKR